MPGAGPWRSYAMLAASMTLVGGYVALSKPLVAAFPVFLLAWLRFGIAALAMAPHTRVRDLVALPRDTWAPLFLQSFFGNFLFSICMLYGVSQTSATASGLILATLPAVVAVLSALLLRERLTPRMLAAIALAVAGLGVLAAARGESGSASLTGNLLILGAVCCEALYVVIGKGLAHRLPALKVSALINLVGMVLMMPFGMAQAWSFDFGAVGAGHWALLLFYALAASVFAVWLWMSGLRGVPAAHAGVFTIALPIAATAVGVLFLGERLAWSHAVAFACAAGGILLTTWPEPRAAG